MEEWNDSWEWDYDLEKMGIGMIGLGKKVSRKEMAHIGGLMEASMWVFGVTSQKIRMGLITFSPTVGSSGCGWDPQEVFAVDLNDRKVCPGQAILISPSQKMLNWPGMEATNL